jgi:RNA polymerase sigma-70 factor (ECF subfamily)
MPPNKNLIDKILHGESDLFAQIVDEYDRQILVYCLKMLNFHQEDAEDVAMQVFTKVYLNLASYNSKQKFSSWIYRIAHNETVNFIKKNSRQWTVELTDFLPVFSQPKEDYFNSQILDKVLNNLKSNDKEILILFYLQELSLQEIGDVLKLTENSVAQRLRRARNRAKDEAKKLNL